MAVDSLVAQTTGTFKRVGSLIPYFGASQGEVFSGGTPSQTQTWWSPGDNAHVKECFSVTGPKPGQASIVIPQTPGVNFESANSVAFRTDSAFRFIMRGTRCCIKYRSPDGVEALIWEGVVTNVSHERDQKDGIVIIASDSRDDLQDIRIVGRYQINPVTGLPATQVQLVLSKHAHFNPEGRPNAIFDAGGDVSFAPEPDFGLGDDESPPDASVGSQTKACYWTLALMLRYLQYWYTPGAYSGNEWKWMFALPSNFYWPNNFASLIDQEIVANFDNGVGQNNSAKGSGRKGRDINIEGMLLLEAVEYILYTAGGWSMFIEPSFDEEV